MASDQRVKGQETALTIVVASKVVTEISAIKSFEGKIEMKIIEEGYLGETVNRFDDIVEGYSFRLEFDFDDPDVFGVIDKIQKRAKREIPYFKVNITSTLSFPNGSIRRAQLQDCVFGGLPLGSSPARDQYVKGSIEVKASKLRLYST